MFHRLEKKYRVSPKIRQNVSQISQAFSRKCCMIVMVVYSIVLTFYLFAIIDNCDPSQDDPISKLTHSITSHDTNYDDYYYNSPNYYKSHHSYGSQFAALTDNLFQLFDFGDTKQKYPETWKVYNSPSNKTKTKYNDSMIITQSYPLTNYHLTSYFDYNNTDPNRALPVSSIYSYLPDNIHFPTKEIMCRLSSLVLFISSLFFFVGFFFVNV